MVEFEFKIIMQERKKERQGKQDFCQNEHWLYCAQQQQQRKAWERSERIRCDNAKRKKKKKKIKAEAGGWRLKKRKQNLGHLRGAVKQKSRFMEVCWAWYAWSRVERDACIGTGASM